MPYTPPQLQRKYHVPVYEIALSYASAGIYVNPVYVQRGPDGKKQVRPVGRWREMSTISKADIYTWWGPGQEHERAGILIDCGKSRLVVVDPDGPEGVANWLALNPPIRPSCARRAAESTGTTGHTRIIRSAMTRTAR